MGHEFHRTFYRPVDHPDPLKREFKQVPCWSYIDRRLHDFQVQVLPSHAKLEGRLTERDFQQYIQDVLSVFPKEFVTQVDDWTFQYNNMDWTDNSFWKRLGCAELLRYAHEFWYWVEEYHNLRNEHGIPIDVALVCCGLGPEESHPSAHNGHSFACSLTGLRTWKNFSIKDSFLAYDGPYIWPALHREPWFKGHYNTGKGTWLPNYFKMTRKVYESFLVDGTLENKDQLHYAIG